MNSTEIIQAVTECLAEVTKREVRGLTPDTRLFEDLHLDSTSILELLMAVEDRVDIEVDPERLNMDDFQTVGTLAAYVGSHLGVTA
ncbi:MAG TPA: acyl carrier protein [Streptosporangiaceae bacterium]